VAIGRWRPASDLASLHGTMDRLFSDVFGDSLSRMGGEEGGATPTFHLPVDIRETDNGYVIEAPIPGFKPEDVEVTFSDGVLTINARRKEEREKREGEYLRREMVFGNLQRRIGMPGDVQADNIRATFDNGVLRVEVPRAEKPQPRRIEVQPGQQADQGQPIGEGQASDQAQTSDQAQKESSETSGSETVGSSASRS
jgi:HSP20 family protein